MKKILVSFFAIALMGFTSTSYSGFCDGWEDGYQQALDDCLRVGVTPICPIEPINSSGYKTGYGMGYAKGQKQCD